MKKIFSTVSIIVLFTCANSFAQDKVTIEKEDIKPARDFITLSMHYDIWLNTPEEVNITGFGRGFSGHLSYDFPIKQSHFSFAPGIGISTSNIYFDKQILSLNQRGDSMRFINVDTSGIESQYKSSKYNYTYLEMPLELRYFSNKNNRNKGFKMSAGVKVGLLIGAKTRVKHNIIGTSIIEKVNSRRYLATWRFVPTLRMGYGNFSVFGSYQVNSLFNPGEGPAVYPLSIGISISGL